MRGHEGTEANRTSANRPTFWHCCVFIGVKMDKDIRQTHGVQLSLDNWLSRSSNLLDSRSTGGIANVRVPHMHYNQISNRLTQLYVQVKKIKNKEYKKGATFGSSCRGFSCVKSVSLKRLSALTVTA